MESPLQVDDPGAAFRVHCPTCRQNIWAGLEEPPGTGDEMLANHACPGPADIDAAPEPAPHRSLRAVRDDAPTAVDGPAAGSTDTTMDTVPDTARPSGYPTEPAPPLG
jgi:hypothetical protein